MAARTKRLGSLETIAGCNAALSKLARAMYGEEMPTVDGQRIASVVVMVRDGLQLVKMEQLEERLAKLETGNG